MSASLTTAAYHRKLPLATAIEVCTDALRLLSLWRIRSCNRQRIAYLLQVGPHLIGDIGLTIEEAECEASKAFWRS